MDKLDLILSILWGLFWGSGLAYGAYTQLKVKSEEGFSLTRLFVSIMAFIVAGGLSGIFAYLYLNI